SSSSSDRLAFLADGFFLGFLAFGFGSTLTVSGSSSSQSSCFNHTARNLGLSSSGDRLFLNLISAGSMSSGLCPSLTALLKAFRANSLPPCGWPLHRSRNVTLLPCCSFSRAGAPPVGASRAAILLSSSLEFGG